MLRITEKQIILTTLLERTSQKQAEELTEILLERLFPPEWEETETLEQCFSCAGKGHIIIRVEHPKSNSTSSYNVLCGRCYGTGKLIYIQQDRY